MADKPVTEVVAVDAALDALSSPTSSDVYDAVDGFNEKAVASAAAARALAGGGSQPPVPFVQPSNQDPGAVGAGALWVQSDTSTVAVRNSSDDDWLVIYPLAIGTPGLGDVLAVDSDGGGLGLANTGDIGTAGGDIATGGGAIDTGGGNATLNRCRIDENLDHNGAAVGFYGTAPVARPMLPIGPSANDISAALVALGLVTQDS